MALELTQTKFKDEKCIIYSDSAYCVNTFNEWILGWASSGWKRGRRLEEIKNLDLVKELYFYKKINFPNFEVRKIKGHQGNIGNELADAAASNDLTKLAKILEANEITSVEG